MEGASSSGPWEAYFLEAWGPPRPLQVSIMTSTGRPAIQRATLDRLAGAGGLFDVPLACPPRIYHAGPVSHDVERPGFELRFADVGKPYVRSFWRVILDAAEVDAPLLFIENDVWAAEGFVPFVAGLDVPPWFGLVTFFDGRGDARPHWRGLNELPRGRVFWNSQAILVPAETLRRVAPYARGRDDFGYPDSWDIWIGRAVEAIGQRVALHVPSLVQHLGVTRSEVFPGDAKRPVARDFVESWPTIEER